MGLYLCVFADAATDEELEGVEVGGYDDFDLFVRQSPIGSSRPDGAAGSLSSCRTPTRTELGARRRPAVWRQSC
jgi:hypothetical protein